MDYKQFYNYPNDFAGPILNVGKDGKLKASAAFIFDSLITAKGHLIAGNQTSNVQVRHFSEMFYDYREWPNSNKTAYITKMEINPFLRVAGEVFIIVNHADEITAKPKKGRGIRLGDLSHTHGRYLMTSEFIMTSIIPVGIRLNQYMAKIGVKNIYGPRTLSIMNSMGYPTWNNTSTMLELVLV